MIIHEALYISHPSVVSAIEIEGVLTLKDSNDSDVAFDQSAYDAALIQLEQERQAREALRTSVINKIATNLTSEEKAWLEENL